MAETTLHVEKMRGLLLLHMGGVGRASSRGRVTQPTSSSRGAFDPGAGKASCYTGYILHQASAQSPEQWQKKGEKGKKKKWACKEPTGWNCSDAKYGIVPFHGPSRFLKEIPEPISWACHPYPQKVVEMSFYLILPVHFQHF
jgi:hypothetical protein